MRALAAAWITTLLIFGVTALALQLTYEPPVPESIPERESSEIPVPQPQLSAQEDAAETVGEDAGEVSGSTEDTVSESDVEPQVAPPLPDEAEARSDQTEEAVSTVVVAEATPAEPSAGSGTSVPPPESFEMSPIDPFLQEEGPYGPLPLTRNARQPWQVYGRGGELPSDTPQVAVILTGMGLNNALTSRAIEQLPDDITLAFSPYGQRLAAQANAARSAGHETLLMIPMEPQEYPLHDPGPHTLLATDPAEANLDKLYYALSRFQGYVGVINEMGSKFTASAEAMAPVMLDLQKRGLLFVDSRSSRYSVAARSAMEHGVPRAINSRFIDDDLNPEAIDSELSALEETARSRGVAVGIAHPYPISIERIRQWAEGLSERGVALAPVTAVANRQDVR